MSNKIVDLREDVRLCVYLVKVWYQKGSIPKGANYTTFPFTNKRETFMSILKTTYFVLLKEIVVRLIGMFPYND